MTFLEDLSTQHRDRLVRVATSVPVAASEYLVRRGDPGGDLFVVVKGRIAIVDTRTRPTTIIATMEPGDVIGEVAFLDRSPRSADVRADTDAVVLHWRRADVNELIERDPALGSAFFEALCRISVRRLRRLTTHTVVHRSVGAPSSPAPQNTQARHDAEQLTGRLKAAFRTAELALRTDPENPHVRRGLTDALDAAQVTLTTLGAAHTGTDEREELASILRSELQPWLMRSFLAERSLRRARGTIGTPETLSHVLVGRPSGDGPLGELLDSWLLDRPTLHAIRESKRALADLVLREAPKRRGRRILVVNAGTGSVLARLVDGLTDTATTITVLDPSRDALGYFDLTDLPAPVSLTAIRHDLAALANGRLHATLPPQDIIAVDDLLCYLPDRLAMTLMRTLDGLLAPNAQLFATALNRSPDNALLEFLLGWPTIRRTPLACARLTSGVELDGVTEPVNDRAAYILRVSPRRVPNTPPSAVARAPSLF